MMRLNDEVGSANFSTWLGDLGLFLLRHLRRIFGFDACIYMRRL